MKRIDLTILMTLSFSIVLFAQENLISFSGSNDNSSKSRAYSYSKEQFFNRQNFTLLPYDANNEIFIVRTEKNEDICLPIPIDEASTFKDKRDENKKEVKSQYEV